MGASMKMRWQHPDWVRIYRGFDMGWWPDPAYCLWVAAVGRQLIPFKEKTWFKTQVKDIAKDIKEESDGMNVVTTYIDPTMGIQRGDEDTLRDIMERHGVPCDVAANNRELYAHAINAALQEEIMPGLPRLQIYQPGCPYLVKTLPMMRFDEKNPLALADHKHDHPPITLAYILMHLIGETTPRTAVVQKRWMKPKKASSTVLGRHNVRRSRS